MAKFNKKKLRLFFCINNLKKGGAEKQINYISNYLSNFHYIYIFVLGNEKISYKFKNNIKIFKLNKFLFILHFIKQVIFIKPNIVFFVLPKAYFLFGTIMIFFPKIKKILLRRSLNYYHKNIIFKKYEIFLHKFTNFFICNSYGSKKDLVFKEHISKNKIQVIDNFIFKPKNKTLPKKSKTLQKKNKIFKILCIANFHRYKGHKLIIDTLSCLKNLPIEVFLLGEDKDLSKKDLINYAKKKLVLSKIKFINKLDLNFKFPNFSLGILFSETESFPNAILEYFVLGLPILAYKTGDIQRLIDSSNGLVFKTRNPYLISKKLKLLFNDNNLVSKSKNSYKRLNEFSDEKKTIKKYLDVVNQITCVE